MAHAAAELGSPEGVREVVSQRLARLGTPTTTLLELAAVAGPEFELTVITQSGPADAELHAALEQAIAHGMIEEVPARGARVPVHARAGAARALRSRAGAAARRAAPAGRRGA